MKLQIENSDNVGSQEMIANTLILVLEKGNNADD